MHKLTIINFLSENYIQIKVVPFTESLCPSFWHRFVTKGFLNCFLNYGIMGNVSLNYGIIPLLPLDSKEIL